MNYYITAKQLQEIIPITYKEALKIINECREEMEKDGVYVPKAQQKIALETYVNKKLGIKK